MEITPEIKKTFKGANSVLRTSSLFWDCWRFITPDRQAGIVPVFSLQEDVEGCINCKKTFLAEADPTGYKWAIKYLYDWEHWLKLCKCPWFREALELWQSELEAKMAHEAVTTIKQIAKGSSPAAFAASKYIAAQDWKKSTSKRGRPTTKEIEQKLREEITGSIAEDADLNRMKPILVVSNP